MYTRAIEKNIIEKNRDDFKKIHFETRFNFTKVHNGVRRGCIHGIIGTKGSGKSSIAQTIISDLAVRNKEVITVWLSEESQLNYQTKIDDINPCGNEYLRFIEESNLGFTGGNKDFLEMAGREILDTNSNVLVIDNITSSRFYSNINNQVENAEWIKDFVKKTKMSIIFLAHTKKEVGDNFKRIITGEDIRGNAHIIILAEYLYVMQKFTKSGPWDIFVILEKHRYHDIGGARIFKVDYHDGIYYRDNLVSFEVFNETFKNREFLGRVTK